MPRTSHRHRQCRCQASDPYSPMPAGADGCPRPRPNPYDELRGLIRAAVLEAGRTSLTLRQRVARAMRQQPEEPAPAPPLALPAGGQTTRRWDPVKQFIKEE